MRNPDATQASPWGAALIIDAPGAPRRSLLIENVGAPIAPRWLNERLIFLRIVWGRAIFSDLILDARSGTLRYHEQAHDGRNAFEQYQAICRGACPCDVEAAMNPDHPSRFSVEAPLPTARAGAQSAIGLLLLPHIFGPPESGGVVPADPSQPVAVYAEPDPKAEPALRLSELAHFEYREYTYEGAAAVVYEQRPGWYAIGLRDQALARGWVRADEVGEFLPMARPATQSPGVPQRALGRTPVVAAGRRPTHCAGVAPGRRPRARRQRRARGEYSRGAQHRRRFVVARRNPGAFALQRRHAERGRSRLDTGLRQQR